MNLDLKKLKPVSIEDKDLFVEFISRYKPYSDFNFTSLWSYDVKNLARWGILNDNLIVRFSDYLDDSVFYTYLGTSNSYLVAKDLLEQSNRDSIKPFLKLIPHEVVESYPENHELEFFEDDDNHDYILSVDELVSFAGNRYGAKRNFVNRFVRLYGDKIRVENLDVGDIGVQRVLIELFNKWQLVRQKSIQDVQIELEAINRLFLLAKHVKIETLGVFLGGDLVAFSIDESVHDGYYMIHFEKADISYVGVFEYLKMVSARRAAELGNKFINYEQDLGIPGLKKAKSSYNPIHQLKKFQVKLK